MYEPSVIPHYREWMIAIYGPLDCPAPYTYPPDDSVLQLRQEVKAWRQQFLPTWKRRAPKRPPLSFGTPQPKRESGATAGRLSDELNPQGSGMT